MVPSSHPTIMDSPIHSILRIKRKRTTGTAPLDALVIEDAAPANKRRKNQLFPTPIRDNPQEDRGIFRFAETVSLDSFDTDKKTRQIRDRITAFILHPPRALARVSSTSSITTPHPSTPPPSSPAQKFPSSSLRTGRTAVQELSGKVSGGRSGDVSPSERVQGKVDGFHQESKRARYRVVEKRREEQMAFEMRRGPLPPVVKSSTDVKPTLEEYLRIIDAVEENEPATGALTKANIIPSGRGDDMMDNFGSMLQEYLTMQDSLTPSLPPTGSSAPMEQDVEDEDDDDFVYDVYYRDLRPREVQEADISMKRIGELAGLQDDEILTNELSSEEEDEADQDSNEENDYRNDYPSSESGSEDEERWEE